MRHELIEQLLAGDPIPGPSALDLDLDLEPLAPADELALQRATRTLTAFDVADDDAEARSFARRRLLGAVVAGAGSTVALAAALALGL